MKRILKFSLITFLVLIIVGGIGFVIWAENPLGPDQAAILALESDDQVAVSQDQWIIYQPVTVQPEIGLIFYPGGRVDPRSYAPLMREIAMQGYLVVLVPMPLNLAVFSPSSAGDVINAYPQIAFWAVGGHSLGGTMAANFAFSNPTQVDGLILWASYPAGNNDLSGYNVPVISIYGTLDMGGMEPFDASMALLPADTVWIVIEGGNHAQFGNYGPQPGDNEATIPAMEQQQQTIEATVDFLNGLGK